MTNHELRTLEAIEDSFVRTGRIGLIKPWPGTFWHSVLRLRAVLPLLCLLVGCVAVVVTASLALPAVFAAPVGAVAGAVAVHAGRSFVRRSRPARR